MLELSKDVKMRLLSATLRKVFRVKKDTTDTVLQYVKLFEGKSVEPGHRPCAFVSAAGAAGREGCGLENTASHVTYTLMMMMHQSRGGSHVPG